MIKHDSIRAVRWQDDHLDLLDQRLLPQQQKLLSCTTAQETADAIRNMVVRGAPAIGITAAYGVVLAAIQHQKKSAEAWQAAMHAEIGTLSASRPTAVNLSWALKRMQRSMETITGDPVPALLAEAHTILEEDIVANRRMGELGAELIEEGSGVLTHCNTGSLATGGYGTALGVIRTAYAQGKICQVFADETRPWLQGARLTAWELVQDGIPVQLNTDSAAAWLMKQGKVQWVIVGADRIAANGDTANKIGTYNLAVTAKYHGVKVMVVAPTSTIDMAISSGEEIPIETRPDSELLEWNGQRIAAEGANAWNPVFDVTPIDLIDVIVTDKGMFGKSQVQKTTNGMDGGLG